jgi:hypothetical protein
MAINFPSSPTNGQQYTEAGQTWVYNVNRWKVAPPSVDNIVTESADLTLSAASHQGAYIRLTKTGSAQVITVSGTGFAVGGTVTFYRDTSQTLSFASGGDTINNAAGLSSVPVGGAFVIKYRGLVGGVPSWDFI